MIAMADLTDEQFETLARRINALMNLSLDKGATPAEAATAAARANALLLKYNLDLARVRAQPRAEEYVNVLVNLAVNKGPYVRAHRTLLHNLARFNFCKMIYLAKSNRAYIVGAKHNVETVRHLYDLMARELHRMADAAWPESDSKLDAEWSRRSVAHARITYTASYLEGANLTIQARLQEQRTKATETPTQPADKPNGQNDETAVGEAEQVRALIVLTDAALTEAVNRFHGETKTTKWRTAARDYGAYRQGQKDAHKLPITKQEQIAR